MSAPSAVTRTASAQERAFYGESVSVLVPAGRRELADVVRDAESEGRAIVPAGEGAHAVVNDAPADSVTVVSAQAFGGTETYQPDDFTIGVGCGTTLGTLRETLAAHGQEIPIDWPAAGGGTVGGLVARAPAGPRQGRYGPLSTFVLGVEGMRGEGRPFKAGGMVVKNVAGYQLGKFLVGSLGAAGFLLRVNFRVRPVPARRRLDLALFAREADAWAWAAELRGSGLEPAALAVLAGGSFPGLAQRDLPDPGERCAVAWIFEGNPTTVDWKRRESARLLAGRDAETSEHDDDAAARMLDFLAALPETEGSVPPDLGIVRIAVLPSALAGTVAAVHKAFPPRSGFELAMAGDPLTGLLTVRWSGAPEAIDTPVKSLRQIVRSRDGTARLFYLPPGARARFRHSLAGDPNAVVTDAVLGAFDPHGAFSRRRGTAAMEGDR